MKISICIPVYNSEKTIGGLVALIKKKFSKYDFEIILVNDGSRDNSEKVCLELADKNKEVVFIPLRKNFGEHNAVMCALNHCTGDYAAIIDDDFQNPPEEILKLIEEASKGYDVVYTKFKNKKHSLFRNIGSKFNDMVATWLLNKPAKLYLSSFKLIKKEVIDEIIKYKGPFPYVDGLILRVTNSITSVFVEHNQRKESRSNYTLKKLVSLWLNMFINFSIKPLRMVSFIGMLLSAVCFGLLVYFIIDKLNNPLDSKGWASIIVTVLFIGSVEMIFLGVIGEYIGKMYLDVNNTPQWVIKKELIKSRDKKIVKKNK